MTAGRLALVIALAGCGRFGFENVNGPAGDGGDTATGMVTVAVTSDEYLAEPAGLPIAGATVLVERAGGTDRLTTDAAGTARFAAAGVIACHVAFKADLGWRLYTVAAPPPGTIELGSRAGSTATHDMSFTLPATTAGDFTVRLPEHCATPPYFGSRSVTASYAVDCEGKAAHVIGYARQPSGATVPDQYVDLGAVTLTSGATRTVAGGYQPLPVRSLQLTNLPRLTDAVLAVPLERSGAELTPMTPTLASVTTQFATAATLSVDTAPGANTVRIVAFGAPPPAYLSQSERIVPFAAGQTAVDAAAMLPLFDSLDLLQPMAISWTGGGTGGTITIIETFSGGLQWDLYLAPSTTSITLPQLPADLGVPVPALSDSVQVVKLDVPGVTAADVIRTIDRRWLAWSHDAVLLPPGGSSITRILYSAGLGPP